MHLRAAEAIERVHARNLDGYVAALAVHYAAAGAAADADKVVDYTMRAGRSAYAAAAYEEAVTHFEAALQILDEERPAAHGRPHKDQIAFVKDRPGHDRRYAIDAAKIKRELKWQPNESFEDGLRKTVRWYLANQEWAANVTSGAYRDWIALHYGERANSA